MKPRAFLLLIAILAVCSQLASAEDSPTQRGVGYTGHTEDAFVKRLRTLLGKPQLDKVSYILTKGKAARITRSQSGQVRVLVGDVSDELLNTKIKRVTFNPIERYNAEDALIPIVRAKEVQTTMRKLALEQPLIASPGLRQEPKPHFPHLAASMKNVAMGEALDRVAETFEGIIIYGEWREDDMHLFSVDFVARSYITELVREPR